MKKTIIFIVAVTLSGAVFAGGFEDFRMQSSLTAFDAQVVNSIDVKMPNSAIDSFVTKGRYKPKYFLQNENGHFICADESGIKGYNEISVSKFISNPKKGECAYLVGAPLHYVNLSGVNMRGANLSGADLTGADLRGAYLSGANLSKTNLRGTYLIGTDLRQANLNGAYLTGADLRNSDLSGTSLKETKLNGTKYNSNTTLPFDDAEAKRRGMVKTD